MIHPVPLSLKKGGTFSSSEAVQMTFVSPISIKADPSADLMKFLVIVTGRWAEHSRPSFRIIDDAMVMSVEWEVRSSWLGV